MCGGGPSSVLGVKGIINEGGEAGPKKIIVHSRQVALAVLFLAAGVQ